MKSPSGRERAAGCLRWFHSTADLLPLLPRRLWRSHIPPMSVSVQELIQHQLLPRVSKPNRYLGHALGESP